MSSPTTRRSAFEGVPAALSGFGLLLVLLAVAPARATDGDPDPTFGTSGGVEVDHGPTDQPFAIAVGNDGDIYAVGFTVVSPWTEYMIAKISPAGVVLATALGPGSSSDEAHAVLMDPPDGLLVAGQHLSPTSTDLFVCRYFTASLTLDPSYGTGGCYVRTAGPTTIFKVTPGGMARASNGNALVAGTLQQTTIGGSPRRPYFVLALDSSGAPATPFGFHNVFVTPNPDTELDTFPSIAVDHAGHVVLAGSAPYSNISAIGIARLNADGSTDTSFGNNGTLLFLSDGNVFDDSADSITFDFANSSFEIGYTALDFDSSWHVGLAHFDAAGNPAPFPGTGGAPAVIEMPWSPDPGEAISGLTRLTSGKLLVAGEGSSGHHFWTTRLLANGQVDTTYGNAGSALYVPANHGHGTSTGVIGLALDGGRPLLLGGTQQTDLNWLVVRLRASIIFYGRFETGDFSDWIVRCAPGASC
jgi:uncharacterized delta-60 repeat protein